MDEVLLKLISIEKLLKQFFQLSSHELLLEEEQVAYFNANPDKYPE